MRFFALLSVAALAVHIPKVEIPPKFSFEQEVKAAKHREMDLEDALMLIEHKLPASVRALVQQGKHKDALFQLQHVGKQSPVGEQKDPFTRAVGFVNDELLQAQEQLDIVTYDCNVFRNEKETLLLENAALLSALGSAISQSSATISDAKGVISKLNDQLKQLRQEHEEEQAVCAATKADLVAQKRAIEGDLSVAEMIQGIAQKECSPTATFLIQSCSTPAGAQLKVSGKAGEALAKFTTPAAHDAVQFALYGAMDKDESNEALAGDRVPDVIQRMAAQNKLPFTDGNYNVQLNTIETSNDEEVNAEDARLEQAVKSKMLHIEQSDTVSQEEDNVVLDVADGSFLQLNKVANHPESGSSGTQATPKANQAKCVTGGKVNCGKLLDKIDQMAGDIKTELNEVKKTLEEHIRDCEERNTQKLGQIAQLAQQLSEYETLLAESTAKLLKDTNSQTSALEEREDLASALKAKMEECHQQIKDISSSLCALNKVRNAMFKQIKKVEPLIEDCEMSDWIMGDCSVKCGAKGVMSVYRNVVSQPGEWGVSCSPAKLERECDNGPCPIDCVVTEWADWTKCTKECGGGVQSRNRAVVTEAMHGGAPCEATSVSRVCNSHSCDVDCVLEEWGAWEPCSKACRPAVYLSPGMQFRRKRIGEPAQGNGKCPLPNQPERLQSQDCNDKPCPDYMRCEAKMDIVVLLDGSGSVYHWGPEAFWDLNFRLEKEFVKRMLDFSRFDWDDEMDAAAYMRYSLIQFSGWPMCSATVTRFCLEKSYLNIIAKLATKKEDNDPVKMKELLDKEQWMMGGTYTHAALTLAKSVLQESSNDRFSTIFLITDGQPSDVAATLSAAEVVKDAGIRLIVVPVKNNVPIHEMCEIASAPCGQNMIRSYEWTSLVNELNRFLAYMCPKTAEVSDPFDDTMCAASDDKVETHLDGICGMRWVDCAAYWGDAHVGTCAIKAAPVSEVPIGCKLRGTYGNEQHMFSCRRKCECMEVCSRTAGCTFAAWNPADWRADYGQSNCLLYGGDTCNNYGWKWGRFATYKMK